MKCCQCRRDRNQDDMQYVVLTDEQRAFIKQHQGIDETESWYCKPCWAVLSDRERGAQLIKGTLQVNLAAEGHPNAQKIAQKMYDRLINLSAKPPEES